MVAPTRIQAGGPPAYINPSGNVVQMSYPDGPDRTAFGDLRTSGGNVGLLLSAQLLDENPLIWETILAGSATAPPHSSNRASTTLTITGEGDSARRVSRKFIRYQPGRSQLVISTFVLGETGRILLHWWLMRKPARV